MTSPAREKSPRAYALRIGKSEIRVGAGETFIGRDMACEIVLDETLVSRKHARLVLEGNELYIEDLRSANGTFVNRARVRGRTPLRMGDRVSLASCEIEVVQYGNDVSSERFGDAADRETPSSGVAVVARVSLSRISSQFAGTATERRPPRSTDALDALESAARLANRMFALGRTDAGRQIVSEPLEEVLAAARCGEVPGPQIADAAGRSAMRLAQETLDGRWIDVAVEIHLVADRPLRAATIEQLVALRARVPLGNDALLARYYERLRARAHLLAPEEQLLCERIAALIPELDEDG